MAETALDEPELTRPPRAHASRDLALPDHPSCSSTACSGLVLLLVLIMLLLPIFVDLSSSFTFLFLFCILLLRPLFMSFIFSLFLPLRHALTPHCCYYHHHSSAVFYEHYSTYSSLLLRRRRLNYSPLLTVLRFPALRFMPGLRATDSDCSHSSLCLLVIWGRTGWRDPAWGPAGCGGLEA